jgi:NAD(P)-dependent dehydrogenase (short-subunit alcohol dehydrogenase family)
MAERHLRTYRGAVAIVTGAASGIGRSLSEELARCGSEVILADLQSERAEAIASAIRAAGRKAQAVTVDVAEAGQVDALIRQTVERTDRLDYLFNNAGIGIGGPIGKLTLEDWERAISVNLRGVIHGVRAAYPIMLGQGFGHIVNTASLGELTPHRKRWRTRPPSTRSLDSRPPSALKWPQRAYA